MLPYSHNILNTPMSELGYHQKCIACGKDHPSDKFNYVCTDCNGLLLVERDEDMIKKLVGEGSQIRNKLDALRYGPQQSEYPNGSGIWRWVDFLLPGFPIDVKGNLPLSLHEGSTDLFVVPETLCKEIGLNKLYIKLEGQNPSGSFKDRGLPTAISEALRLQKEYPELGIKAVACASTGDTSASAAIYAAYSDSLDCIVFVPHGGVSGAQLSQAMNYGSKVVAVKHPNGFDVCMKLVAQYCETHPELVLVNSKNAFRIVGQETIGLEILQDLKWNVPDWVSIPVGNGGNLSALLIGLLRAKHFGIIDHLPGILVGQAEVANTLFRWQQDGYENYEPRQRQESIASAMNINDPVSFPRIAKFIKEFEVHVYSVPEQDIYDTRAQFMKRGAPICPQSAVSLNALIQARNENVIKEDDVVVSIATAVDTKFSDSAIDYNEKNMGKFANPFIVVEGGIDAINKAL